MGSTEKRPKRDVKEKTKHCKGPGDIVNHQTMTECFIMSLKTHPF